MDTAARAPRRGEREQRQCTPAPADLGVRALGPLPQRAAGVSHVQCGRHAAVYWTPPCECVYERGKGGNRDHQDVP